MGGALRRRAGVTVTVAPDVAGATDPVRPSGEPFLVDAVDLLQTLLGPPRCEGCGVRGAALCSDCSSRMGAAAPGPPIDLLDRVLTPWTYAGAARGLVLALKLDGRRAAAGPLVDGLRAEVMAEGLLAGTITWVPGRRGDIRRRGFDHAEVIARGLARRLGLPSRPIVVRLRNPPDQTSLGRTARRQNLVGAFGAQRCSGAIALVDDLVTTGATATACAKALRAAGAQGVELLAPCRA